MNKSVSYIQKESVLPKVRQNPISEEQICTKGIRPNCVNMSYVGPQTEVLALQIYDIFLDLQIKNQFLFNFLASALLSAHSRQYSLNPSGVHLLRPKADKGSLRPHILHAFLPLLALKVSIRTRASGLGSLWLLCSS